METVLIAASVLLSYMQNMQTLDFACGLHILCLKHFFTSHTPYSASAVFSAEALLLWILLTGTLFLRASCSALFTILWDTVLVKSTTRSGHPICFFQLPFSFANTFARCPSSLQMDSY